MSDISLREAAACVALFAMICLAIVLIGGR